MLDNWEAQDEPEHLRTIRNRLLYDDAIAARLLGLYQQLLMGETMAVDASREQLELRLAGLVVETDGRLAIKNLIYRRIFNEQWVEQQLAQHAGAYANADMGGYQILLNYHGDMPQFHTVSLQDMLAGRVSEEMISDRVILIGVTSPTVNDLLLTPYSRRVNGIPTQMPGVIVHANIVSQLLSAALNGRPLMRVWSVYAEYGWIMGWVLLGASMGSWPRRMMGVAIASTVSAIVLIAICYLAFLTPNGCSSLA